MGKASSIRKSLIHALLAATTAGFLASSAQAFFFPRPITVPPRNVQDPGNSVTPYTPPPPPPPPPSPPPSPPPGSQNAPEPATLISGSLGACLISLYSLRRRRKNN